ncbi:MAG: hypothetical protein JNM22_06750 [Saprospiraceae bacterium]|nr:hypothetical protein [Saprospiraceae bacterium]
MKNLDFSIPRWPIFRHSLLLLLVVVFTLGSCRKDTDLPVATPYPSHEIALQTNERTSDIESQAVVYAQWMLTNLAPLAKDPLVYEDLKAGLYSSQRVNEKLKSLGFNSIAHFSVQLSAISAPVTQALNTGAITKEYLSELLLLHASELDLQNMLSGAGTGALVPGVPTPCYDQLIDHLALVAVEIAIGASAGPWGAVLAGTVGVLAAYIDFQNCLDENYPK